MSTSHHSDRLRRCAKHGHVISHHLTSSACKCLLRTPDKLKDTQTVALHSAHTLSWTLGLSGRWVFIQQGGWEGTQQLGHITDKNHPSRCPSPLTDRNQRCKMKTWLTSNTRLSHPRSPCSTVWCFRAESTLFFFFFKPSEWHRSLTAAGFLRHLQSMLGYRKNSHCEFLEDKTGPLKY